ncbi:hypothetical protein C0J52_06070 [Blattella germanica]|nr:hypothetical protein C0J52_06070 [Blattella germanica]
MAEEMCEYLANGTCFEVYGNGEFHRKLQEDHNFDYSYIKNMCNESSADIYFRQEINHCESWKVALRLKFKKVVELWLLEQKRNYLYYFNYKNIIVRT